MSTDLLSLRDRSDVELSSLVERVRQLSPRLDGGPIGSPVYGRRVALLWDGLALRNRAAFDLAGALLGTTCVEAKGGVGQRETTRDLAGYLDNWFDVLVVRCGDHEGIGELARYATAPVINAGSEHSHPIEVLSDLAYLADHHTAGADLLHLVFFGPSTNVLQSWIEASERYPIEVTQVCPREFAATATSSARFSWTSDIAAVSEADVLYTDCWWPARTATGDRRREVLDALYPYKVTADLVAQAPPSAPVLHGPPITLGLEMAEDVASGPRCPVMAAKRYLLPASATAILDVLGER